MTKRCSYGNCKNPAFSKGRCKWHPAKATGIRPVSKKRLARLIDYGKLKRQYFVDHPICEFPGCFRRSETIHHKKHREGERLNDTSHWMALCGGEEPCHKYIHANPRESYEKGWLVKG